MKRRIWILLCLLAVAGTWLFWPRPVAVKPVVASPAAPALVATAAPAPKTILIPGAATNAVLVKTNPFAYRLTNTPKTVGELTVAPRAILLENALIDTAAKLDLKIPAHLRATGEPGAYIVQARGVVTAPFRAALAGAGAQIISYIPNNAYLVQLSGAGAAVLSGNAQVQAVLPFEPYFKMQLSLLGLAVNQKPLPAGQALTLGLFAAGADTTVAQIEKMGAVILATDRSPFGPIVRVRPPANWIALAQLPGVQRVEPTRQRVLANDLSRVALGIATDTLTNACYLGLTGSNVLVEVNDTGIDATHPDFNTGGNPTTAGAAPIRVNGDSTNSLNDVNGHGTHVAGIIAGNGSQSINPTNVGAVARGSITNADFRGKAPLARLFSVNYNSSDSYLQEAPARTNALISNNSWVNGGANVYDLSAASYDAAVRDALPTVTGPQPVLFVFPAGNDGGAVNNNGGGGSSDTILSPGTAKNVITVGSLEQFRNITNIVTALDGSSNMVWKGETSSGSAVADYSARGNVGVQTEGTYGRFKPDVVAPGTFVVSTRSSTWDKVAYYNRTNYHNEFSAYGLYADTNTLAYAGANVPINAIAVTIHAVANKFSPTPFPILPIYISSTTVPNPANPATYDFVSTNNLISIPSDGGAGYIANLLNGGFLCAIASTNLPVNFDLLIQIVTTNDLGNQLEVLSNLNETLGPYYYYETGTSIATPAVSGALALMQDFFTNTLHTTPSPALLKAMLINGARLTSGYNNYGVTNSINYEGWGLVNVPNSIPAALTNTTPNASNTVPMYFLDQSPTNVLATGDSRTYLVSAPTASARNQMLHITLAWTDPPGNPVAGIKLVNNLDLIVTNLDTGAIYYGNYLAAGTTSYSVAVNSNAVPDAINNVENVLIQTPLGTNYAVTVVGRNVTVNAVTAEQTNIVQDYALVISCGDSANTNGVSVTPAPANISSRAQSVTFVDSTNAIYFNQIAGANAPWLSTNTILFGTNSAYATNAVLGIGQTNQWHFFIVTNTTTFTNAAFIIFLPNTLAIPREGVFAGTDANSTRPEADLDMFVTSPLNDPNASGLTNLDPTVIANCIAGVNGDAAALTRGGTEFVVYSNSTPGQVYYIGVQCQDQMAGQFAFVPIFSQEPFSRTDANGNQVVNGLLLPANIPDGDNAHPGRAFVLGLAIMPMNVGGVTVTNSITHQNYGDLIGTLSHNTAYAVLNNHDGLPNPVVNYTTVYNDDGLPGYRHTDGPGSLRNFRGTQAVGLWILAEVDDNLTQTGTVTGLTLVIRPHRDLRKQPFVTVTVPAGSWFYDYVDVPVGYTNLTVLATNLPPTSTPPILLALQYNIEPTISNNIAIVGLTNGTPPGNSISYGPPLTPGRYFIGLFNPDIVAHDVLLGATLAFDAAAITTLDDASTGPVPLQDDAVTYDSIFVTNTDLIQTFSVGLRVDHPRISDLVFHLISPDGSRYLLMENRGGQTTNGCGLTVISTNNFAPVTANGGGLPQTNYYDLGKTAGSVSVNWDMFTVPDEMTVYYGTNSATFSTNGPGSTLLFDSGFVSNTGNINLVYGPGTSTFVTIIMNQFGNAAGPGGTQWTYTIGGVQTNYEYLTFTEDTNLTTTPIKFAVPPFVPVISTNTAAPGSLILSSFDSVPAGDYSATTVDGWNVVSNQVSVVNDPTNAQAGNQFLALASGSILRTLPTTAGQTYTLTYSYRGPGIVGLWRGENNANDDIYGNNGGTQSVTYAPGEVGQAFAFDPETYGGNTRVEVPDQPVFQLTNSLSIEGWVRPRGDGYVIFWRGDNRPGYDPYALSMQGNNQILFQISDPSNNGVSVAANLAYNQWWHVAGTFDGNSGSMKLYVNGSLVSQTTTALRPMGPLISNQDPSVCIGNVNHLNTFPYRGDIDEISLYSRALSASEVQAIYSAGTAGKFDPASAFPQNLAKAQVTLTGVTNNILFGVNTNWQTSTITFTATQNGTPFQIDGLEPGMLLDSFVLSSASNVLGGVSNLYYQAEQSLDPIIGTPANGTGRVGDVGDWQLEVLDNRAGATNNATLVSWQLAFQFANTNFSIPTSTNIFNGPVTNTLPGGSIAWYLITTPTNADWATNTLLFATLPLNLWFSTNAPPTITNAPGDVLLLANSTGGSAVIGTNTTPAFFVPGGTYYLGVQNSNVTTATYAINVTFHIVPLLPSVITTPATNITAATATLDALVNPNGAVTLVYFEYGLTTNYGLFSTSLLLTNNLFTAQPLGIGVTNLTPGSIYHFQAIGTNVIGTNYGGDLTFTNPFATAPFSSTLPATLVAGPSAQLNGMATPNGSAATAWFEWGTSPAYGLTTPPVTVGTNYNVVFVTNRISGLMTNVPYHFHLVVSNVVGVTYGFDHIFDQANVVAWGADYVGQATVPASLTNLVTGIGAGYEDSLAVNNNGTVVAWGIDTFRQTNVPAGLNNAVAVAGGDRHSLALRSSRTVLVWGSNQFGQTNTPANLTNAVGAASGGIHCLALRANGNVVAWGGNSYGQTNVPAIATNVVAVAGGELHSLVLKNNGTVTAWGYNVDGETNVPAGLTNVVAIAAGGYHNLALKKNGTVVAWGYNTDGETNVPTGLTNVIAIAAGGFHSLALKSDGTVVAWGDNSALQTTLPVGLSNVVAIAGGGLHSLALSSLFGLNQTNNYPFWTNTIPTVTMNEMTTLLVTNAATDTNYPPQTLQYILLNSPAWASIDYRGIITLSPLEPNAPSTNVITTVVTDNGYPPLSATNTFTVIVLEPNEPPVWTNSFPLVTMNELTTNTVVATAQDDDVPPGPIIISYQLTNSPAWAAIDANGIITLTPQEVDGPTNAVITVIATGNGAPPLSATTNFLVTVNEVNTPPFWPTNVPSATNYIINALNTLVVTNTASDSDIPVNPLTYTLQNPPAGVQIDTNGIITWLPGVVQASTNSYAITTIVTDTNPPAVNAKSLSATNHFTVTVLPPFSLTNGVPQTNGIVAGGLTYYLVNVPTNADVATNRLLAAAPGGLNLWFTTNAPPSIGSPGDVLLLTNTTSGQAVINPGSTPRLMPGSFYWLGVQNTNSFAVAYGVEVDFHLASSTNAPTNAFSISSIVYTNGGFLLTWFAPSNDLFQVQWTTSLVPALWTTFPIPPAIRYNTNFPAGATNAQFNFFDDGSQTGGFGPTRFYRLLLLQATNTLTLPAQSNLTVSVSTLVTVTNTAADSRINAVLTYSLVNSPTNAAISTNGIITWTNATPPGLAARFTTLVTDDSLPPVTASNTFTVFVAPLPAITNVLVTATNVVLQWSAPTSDQFQVEWTTNLVPVINWFTFPAILTSTNGLFSFTDTNAPLVMKFYRLLLLP